MTVTGGLPEQPPAIEQAVAMNEDQRKRARTRLKQLSKGLEGCPVLLSQDGNLEAHAGSISAENAERIARQVGRLWQEGSALLARELIRFEEERLEEGSERASYMLYSLHIEGALTLTVGWQSSASLTQIRAESSDLCEELYEILRRP